MKRLVVFMLIASLAACGDDASSPTPGGEGEFRDANPGQVGQDQDATDANNYAVAYQICGGTPVDQLVSDLGAASSDPTDIAEAYGLLSTERFRPPSVAGCLDALTRQPQEWP